MMNRTYSSMLASLVLLCCIQSVQSLFLPQKLTPRYNQGLSAPLGYNYAWAIDNYRLTMVPGAASAYTYMTRYTVDKTSCAITQPMVANCTAKCDTTLNCAMAHLVLFTNGTNPEGNIVCALYNHPTTVYWAQNRADNDNSMGSVQSSYEFDKTFDNWLWQSTPGTMCSEGTQTGYSLNVHQGSTDVVIDFEDGGICYDYASCYQQGKAYNMGIPFNETTFIQQNIELKLQNYFLTNRSSNNPFNAASYAWIPYCTGDLHSGNHSVIYPPNTQETHHRGNTNSQAIMKAVLAALPNTQRVWIAGSSAGGFGAILQYQQALNIFGSNIRVDLIADSAENKGNNIFYPSLKIVLPSTSACPTCNLSNFDSFLPGYASARPNYRFAALSFTSDSVLPSYENVSQASMDAEISSLFQTLNTKKNSKTFLTPGSGHVALSNPGIAANNGLTIATFLQNFKNDSTTWSSGM